MTYITWVTELIEKMPEILPYIVYGYIFLTAYYWMSFKDNSDFTNLLTKSIATSFILKSCFDLIIVKYEIIFYSGISKTVILVAISAILGFSIGKIISHRLFNRLLHKLHIGRTTNENIWDDVIKPNTWIRVFMKDGSSYLGQYRYGEPFKSEPIIVLATYQKFDNDTDIVIDNSQKMNELIMINTKDFDRIEITYTEKNSKNYLVTFFCFLYKKIKLK